MLQNKTKPKHLFNDQWIMIIGALVLGIIFPLLFGMRPLNPEFLKWIILSITISFTAWGGSRKFGQLLWSKFPWDRNPLIHIGIVIVYIFVFTGLIILLIFVVNFFVEGKIQNYWKMHSMLHLLILMVFIFSVMVHEAIYLFFMWKRELTRSADLEKENIRSKFDALKNHVNPHFLFNSLGTLSSLINTDRGKAIKYVNEFSKIYRYFLEVNSTDFVTLKEELNFINSYIFLQKIRHGEGFTFENNIDNKYYSSYILPLTMQLLVENALKHNSIDMDSPLNIKLTIDEMRSKLVIQNNLQLRTQENSIQSGLNNLEQRYLNFVGEAIYYKKDDRFFTVEIPLISNEK